MKNSDKAVKMLSALVVGAAIGGALGILFAPEKGVDIRKKITGKSDELTDVIKDKFEEILGDIKKSISSMQTKSNEIVENGRLKVEKYI